MTVMEKLVGIGSKSSREKDDFYSTPSKEAQSLFDHESFTGSIWECACGDGAISKTALSNGYDVLSTDLVDRGYGASGVDFLMEYKSIAPNIVTNPPFKLAKEFVEHALALVSEFPGNPKGRKVAMLLKLGFLEGPTKAHIVNPEAGLARVHIFRRRVSFLKGGTESVSMKGRGGMIAFAWIIWEIGFSGVPTLHWIEGEK
ncbi:NAD(P)-dependent oxidoreductase [Kiloniella sp. b19]|uniref:NAD(P)-dependent oxidoreductase n=1 Tax=Kiloniella sp. GXU_MW_B19 TaxID=3141326 RepID=UPI0031D503AC